MELAMLRERLQTLTGAGSLSERQGNALAITPVRTGISALDEALVLGGLPAGRVTEIAGSSSSGKTALGLQLLAEQTRAGKLVAFVDGMGQFYPPAAAAMGIDLRRALLITPRSIRAGSKRLNTRDDDPVIPLARATEIITRCRAFSMVLLDLPQRARVLRTPARRLRVAAQATGTTIIVLSSRCGDVEGAAARIETRARRGASARGASARGASAQRTLLQEAADGGRHTQVYVSKGGSGMSSTIEYACKQHRFDNSPPRPVAAIQYRAQPGEEEVASRRPQ